METSAGVEKYAFIESVVNSISEPITVINRRHEVTWMNKAARAFLFGDSIPSKPLLRYECHHKKKTPCDEIDYDCPLNKCCLSREPLTVVHEHFRSDGQKRLVEIVSSPVCDEEGNCQLIIQVARDITEQRKLAEEISSLASIIQSIPDAVCSIDLDGTIHTWNEGAEKMLGYKAKELLGKHITAVVPKGELDHCLTILNTEGFFTGYESVRITKDGRVVPVEVTGVAIRDKDQNVIGYASVMRDITERKVAEAALRQSEEYFRALTENTSDIVTILEADGMIRYESLSIERVLGYEREELIGRDVFELVHPDDKTTAMNTLSEGLQKPGVPLSIRVRFLHKNGTWRVLEVIGKNLIDNPSVGGIVVNSRDITEREQAIQDLKRTADELARSNADLLQFAYVASHDLQEPLRIIDGFTKLLAQRYKNKLDEKAEEFIGFTIDGVKRMQELIKDILEYSKAGTKDIDLKPSDISLAVEKAISNLKAVIEEHGAIVTYDKLPTVMIDASQMSSLFQNLLGNAIKFHGTEAPRVHVSAERKENGWLFSVKDNGIGIAVEAAERIFVVFQRLHNREEYPGTGIGLAICKRIVERHGGRIWVESEPGNGSTFYFTVSDREVTTGQRQCQRVRKEILFDFHYQGQRFKASTMDISEDGLSIKIYGNPSVKEDTVIDLSVEDLRIKAKVIWVKSLPDKSVIGLQRVN